MNSKLYYDAIAKDYSDLTSRRSNYLLAVEAVIAKCQCVENYLDVGCGDGERSLRIIEQLNPKHSVLLDESDQMLERMEVIHDRDIKLIVGDFLEQTLENQFDLISCLWNVFGHLESKELRLKFLQKMHANLKENGVVFLDVNNRYNISSYGIKAVMANLFKDLIGKSRAGYYTLSSESEVLSQVYIHKPFEIDKILKEAGFSKFEKFYIDYETGKMRGSFLNGQVLYKAYY